MDAGCTEDGLGELIWAVGRRLPWAFGHWRKEGTDEVKASPVRAC